MIKLENWTEVTKGLYRFVMAEGHYYEIYIMYHSKGTDILSANASLYIVNDCSHYSYFEREIPVTRRRTVTKAGMETVSGTEDKESGCSIGYHRR